MAEAERNECSRCGSLIAKGNHEVHRVWHMKVEPNLETPTSEFGFWDEQGRWNMNSQEW